MYHNMIAIFRISPVRPRGVRFCAGFALLACLFSLTLAVPVCFANEAAGTLPPEVQKGVDALLAMQNPKAPVPDAATLRGFLDYAMSPLNLSADGKDPYPAKRKEGVGIFWRAKLAAPLSLCLQYLYNPKLPSEAVYPASIRRAYWEPGPFTSLAPPLWEQLGKHKDTPMLVRGVEFEEITPDTFSGSYYSYTMDRAVLVTEYEGQQAIVSLTWQRGKSNTGKKATPVGKYEDWDFVYSGVPGTLASGIGWAETYMYASCSILVLYEDAPGSNSTGYSMFKWLDAGWASMNMVKQSHIKDGAERSFAGLKSFMGSPRRPSPREIETYAASLRALDLPALQQRFAPYSAKVSEAAATNKVLQSDDFQKVIKDGGYGKSLTKEEIIAAMVVNFIKGKLGKPQLAGPLQ